MKCSFKTKTKKDKRENNRWKSSKYSFKHYLNINSVKNITFIKNLHQDFVLSLHFLHPFNVLCFKEFTVSSWEIIAKWGISRLNQIFRKCRGVIERTTLPQLLGKYRSISVIFIFWLNMNFFEYKFLFPRKKICLFVIFLAKWSEHINITCFSSLISKIHDLEVNSTPLNAKMWTQRTEENISLFSRANKFLLKCRKNLKCIHRKVYIQKLQYAMKEMFAWWTYLFVFHWHI